MAFQDGEGFLGAPSRMTELNGQPMARRDSAQEAVETVEVAREVRRRARAAELPPDICNHTFRATGITAHLENGGNIGNAQAIACHESPRTTKLYDRTSDAITLDEVERIAF